MGYEIEADRKIKLEMTKKIIECLERPQIRGHLKRLGKIKKMKKHVYRRECLIWGGTSETTRQAKCCG